MHSIATRNDAMIYAMVRVQKDIYIWKGFVNPYRATV